MTHKILKPFAVGTDIIPTIKNSLEEQIAFLKITKSITIPIL